MNFINNMSVKAKIISLLFISVLSFILLGTISSANSKKLNESTASIYKESYAPLSQISKINETMVQNLQMLLLAGYHDPHLEVSKEHEKTHKVDMHLDEIPKNADKITKLWEQYLQREMSAKEKELANEWAASRKLFVENGLKEAIQILKAGDYTKAQLFTVTNVLPLFKDAKAKADKFLEFQEQTALSLIKNANDTYETVKITLIAIIIVSLTLLFTIGILIVKSMVSSVNSLQNGLLSFFSFLNRETNKAELINLNTKDEFGQMAKAIDTNISAIEKGLIADANAVANSVEVANKIKAGYLNEQITVIPNNPQLVELRNVLNEMLQTLSNKVSYDLNELELVFKAYIASDFTARIKNPKGQVDIITNNLGDEISTMLSNSLQNGIDLQTDASTLKQAVESLSTASNQQAASLEETAAAMEEMTSNVQNNVAKSNDMALMATQTDSAAREGAVLASRTASAMTEIQSATNSINDAVAIIENIAFQTNILSLNAAVEAATAGDAGKGFAVVAQEVRNLANRSADAAKEIKAMASQAAHKSNEGMNIATELTRGFEVIADKIAQTASMVQDVSNANREQMQGIGQINTAVTQLDQMTQENAKVAAQADAIANATISKAEAMVQDAQSKEFVGKNNIRATATRTNAKPVQAAKPVVVKQKYASNAIAKNSSKHESDVWESF
ncbi:methyl-accepting chemotaxis protein [Sulfurimonas sp.]|uniref:HAMP domain-containing methyl-accepting chemotaxis protein n=1 Tax=Sulfurimonas sp. TaxID=2022749 RepID=UPI0026055B20|nr:methyl-accepting chemotaxis protein [Sulfurimonas sp.]MDD3856398.1 methyl-accepting chemotaxis protein [Sulfurimonas sp.]